MTKITNIDNRLRVKGLRATAQRLMICKEIDRAGHIDIDTLYDRLKIQIPSLSLATIYKNMHSLVDKNIISEVTVTGKKTLFEISSNPHIHHICTECGEIEDIPYEIKSVIQNISALKGKEISDCELTVYGICQKCSG